MYVAITRARKRLYLSFSQTRMLHGQTRYNVKSRFLDELPEAALRWITPRNQGFGSGFAREYSAGLGARLGPAARSSAPAASRPPLQRASRSCRTAPSHGLRAGPGRLPRQVRRRRDHHARGQRRRCARAGQLRPARHEVAGAERRQADAGRLSRSAARGHVACRGRSQGARHEPPRSRLRGSATLRALLRRRRAALAVVGCASTRLDAAVARCRHAAPARCAARACWSPATPSRWSSARSARTSWRARSSRAVRRRSSCRPNSRSPPIARSTPSMLPAAREVSAKAMLVMTVAPSPSTTSARASRSASAASASAAAARSASASRRRSAAASVTTGYSANGRVTDVASGRLVWTAEATRAALVGHQRPDGRAVEDGARRRRQGRPVLTRARSGG